MEIEIEYKESWSFVRSWEDGEGRLEDVEDEEERRVVLVMDEGRRCGGGRGGR
jgi:hypothetical protein